MTLHLIGEAWRRLNMSEAETLHIVRTLQKQACPVVQFGKDGFDCEVDGTQIFRATRLAEDRFHVRLCSRAFPDI